MPKGKKTSEAKKEEIKAVLAINPEASERDVAKVVGLANSTIHQILPEIKKSDDLEHIRAIKKQEFIANAWEIIGKALRLTEKRFTKALEAEEAFDIILDTIQNTDNLNPAQKMGLINKLKAVEMSNIRDIAITLGTIYDKAALAAGEPTDNANLTLGFESGLQAYLQRKRQQRQLPVPESDRDDDL